MNINWYPGHMTRARRMLDEAVRQVDVVCEVLDARIPVSSRNPDLSGFNKPTLIVLNRADQAEPSVTALWKKEFPNAVETSAGKPGGAKSVIPAVKTLLVEKLAKRAGNREIRLLIAGVPNVGKSTLINSIAGGRRAVTGDKPGVTRGKQWISAGGGVVLLDTPGLLWPKLDGEFTGLHLAFTGAIKHEVLDVEGVAAKLLERLTELYPDRLRERYGGDLQGSGFEMLEFVARMRGFLLPGAEIDIERCARMLLDEFRGGKLGRVSLERPDDNLRS